MGKKVLIFLIVGVIGYGAYMVYAQKNDFSFSFFSKKGGDVISNLDSESLKNKGAQIESAVKGNSWFANQTNMVGEKINSLAQEGKNLTQNIGKDLKEKTDDIIGDALRGIYTAAKRNLGISGNDSVRDISVPPSPVGVMGTKGQNIVFAIDNSVMESVGEIFTLEIEWGDGKKETFEELSKKELHTHAHSWDQTGEYRVRFNMKSGNFEQVYETRVIIN